MTAAAWERQPGESPRAWEARRIYIHMGPSRSIDRVSQEGTERVPKNTSFLKRLSARWKWVESAAAWDAMIAEKAAAARIAEAEESARKWARRAEELPELLYTTLVSIYADIAEYERDVKAGRRKKDQRLKSIMVRDYVAAAPLAERALEMVARQQAEMAAARAAQGAESGGPVGDRGTAALRAFRALDEFDGQRGRQGAG